MYKIGVFGGSFNPPHNGHVSIALETKKELKLDKMLILPTGTSPHKAQASVSFEKRLSMCKLAFSQYEGFEVCDIEGKTSSRNYSINTLRLLKKQYPKGSEFYLLIGADMLFYFHNWHKYEALLKECQVVAAAREDNQYVDMLEYATEIGRIKVLNLPVHVVSSSQIREKCFAHEDISSLVPKPVLEFIELNNIYQ